MKKHYKKPRKPKARITQEKKTRAVFRPELFSDAVQTVQNTLEKTLNNTSTLSELQKWVINGDVKAVKNWFISHTDIALIHNQKLLLYSVVVGDVKMTECLLENGAALNLMDDFDNNLLQIACIKGNLELVELVLNAPGVKRNTVVLFKSVNKAGAKAIHIAAYLGNLALFQYLCKQSVSLGINPWTEYGCFVSHLKKGVILKLDTVGFAVTQGHINIVAYCFQQRPELKTTLYQNQTLPQLAATFGQFAMLRYLDRAGVDITLCDSLNQSIMHYAAESKNVPLAQWVIDKLNEKKQPLWNKNTPHGTPIFFAVNKSDLEMVKLLLKHGADLGDRKAHQSIFVYSLLNHHFDIANYLYSLYPHLLLETQRVNKSVHEFWVYNVLDFCVRNDNVKATKWVLSKKTQLPETSKFGLTSMGMAIFSHALECMELLYQHDASIHTELKKTSILLFLCSEQAINLQIRLFWLLEHGAGIGHDHLFKGGKANFFKSPVFQHHKSTYTVATENKIVIGMSINGERITRKHPGFEKAITNLLELKEILADGIKKIEIITHLDKLIRACELADKEVKEQELKQEISQLREQLLKEKISYSEEQHNTNIRTKIKNDFAYVLQPKSEPKPKPNPLPTKNQRKKQAARKHTSCSPSLSKEELFRLELEGLFLSIASHNKSLDNISNDLFQIENNTLLQDNIDLAKKQLSSSSKDEASHHAQAIVRRFNLIKKVKASHSAISENLLVLNDQCHALQIDKTTELTAKGDRDSTLESLKNIEKSTRQELVETYQLMEEIKFEKFQPDLNNLRHCLGLSAPEKVKTSKPPKKLAPHVNRPFVQYFWQGKPNQEAIPELTETKQVDEAPEFANYILEKESPENEGITTTSANYRGIMPKPLPFLTVIDNDMTADHKRMIYTLLPFRSLNSKPRRKYTIENIEYADNHLKVLSDFQLNNLPGKEKECPEEELQKITQKYMFEFRQLVIHINILAKHQKNIEIYRDKLAHGAWNIPPAQVIAFSTFLQELLDSMQVDDAANKLSGTEAWYVLLMENIISKDQFFLPYLPELPSKDKKQYLPLNQSLELMVNYIQSLSRDYVDYAKRNPQDDNAVILYGAMLTQLIEIGEKYEHINFHLSNSPELKPLATALHKLRLFRDLRNDYMHQPASVHNEYVLAALDKLDELLSVVLAFPAECLPKDLEEVSGYYPS